MNELHVGNTIVILVYFLIIIAIGVGVLSLIIMFIRRNKRLNKLEKKLDKFLSDKRN